MTKVTKVITEKSFKLKNVEIVMKQTPPVDPTKVYTFYECILNNIYVPLLEDMNLAVNQAQKLKYKQITNRIVYVGT